MGHESRVAQAHRSSAASRSGWPQYPKHAETKDSADFASSAVLYLVSIGMSFAGPLSSDLPASEDCRARRWERAPARGGRRTAREPLERKIPVSLWPFSLGFRAHAWIGVRAVVDHGMNLVEIAVLKAANQAKSSVSSGASQFLSAQKGRANTPGARYDTNSVLQTAKNAHGLLPSDGRHLSK